MEPRKDWEQAPSVTLERVVGRQWLCRAGVSHVYRDSDGRLTAETRSPRPFF